MGMELAVLAGGALFADYLFNDEPIVNKAWSEIGATQWWEDNVGNWGGSPEGSYDLTSAGAKSAVANQADETGIPAVARSISNDSLRAVEAQDVARKRARGILQTYTRYDSDSGIGGSAGKTKLGE